MITMIDNDKILTERLYAKADESLKQQLNGVFFVNESLYGDVSHKRLSDTMVTLSPDIRSLTTVSAQHVFDALIEAIYNAEKEEHRQRFINRFVDKLSE